MKTDIRFEFKPYKKDKKRILSLKFYIYENEPQYTPEMIRVLNGLEAGRIGERKLPRTPQKGRDYTQGLTPSQVRAFQYLSNKGVNKRFIVDRILSHPKVNYAPIQTYEDVYMELLWNFFSNKTKAQKKAGAFVTWWKNGKLTANNLHARLVELVQARRKDHERQQSQRGHSNLDHLAKIQNQNFDLDLFRKQHPDVYHQIEQEVRQGYIQALQEAQQDTDLAKYKKSIDHQIFHKCKTWSEQAAVSS